MERGDAFEVFGEAYLATQKTAQAKEVWPFDSMPLRVKEQLALNTSRDMGVDGVIETLSSDYDAYQVKFRAGRPSLTWHELSTFMGLTEQVSQRILFTNCDDLPSLMNDRAGFYCIRGNDLDHLESRDFAAIRQWLDTGAVVVQRKVPETHQKEALGSILAELKLHDRATAVMACGTGKTLLALWTAEQMSCGTVLVLLPSLALVRQTLHEWLKEASWPSLSYLCVCSDPTVTRGVDDLIVRQSDLDFPVSTESETVRQFLTAKFAGTKIVFSTYQSAQVVAEAMDGQMSFNLGIFDEAHKTASREGTKFSFALSDQNLRINKRLFLTATPRHYDVRKKDKEGDAKLVFSMDEPGVYGERTHTLTFADAAQRNIICYYKVLISVVTSETVNEELLRRGEVIVAGDTVKARQVANQIALQQAVEKYGISRVFTFHRSVASAKSFTAQGGEGICAHLPNFQAFHVNGVMPTARREAFLKDFERADHAVMSNARCLTEGVDLPTVDMVAFMSPKRSRVDIVQATGRAMRIDRNNPDKTTGYVLVPLFLEQYAGEAIEEALARTEFQEVWNVLQAMQEQDADLADIIRTMREERGRTRGYDDAHFREKVEVFGPEISLQAMRDSITAQCVDRLGATWDERFGELLAYRDRNCHCNVPARSSDFPQLGRWVNTQRIARKNGNLSGDRIRRLNDIGFIWDVHEASFETMFAKLVAYKQDHKNCNVPARWPDDPQLARWANQTLRRAKKEGYLSEDKIQRLEEIGFVWSIHEAAWSAMFSELVEYKKDHGHCNVPKTSSKYPKLASWVAKQRRDQERLSEDHKRRLTEIGFIWDPHKARWEEMYVQIVEYKKVHGNCNVSQKNSKLGSWVNTQRMFRRKNRLTSERIRRLDEIEFQWEPSETTTAH